jgi:hypothetical protein
MALSVPEIGPETPLALTMIDRFQNDRGQPMRHPDHEAALQRDREARERRGAGYYWVGPIGGEYDVFQDLAPESRG